MTMGRWVGAAAVACVLVGTVPLRAQVWADPANWSKVAEPKATMDIVYYAPGDPGYAPESQLLNVYQNATTPKGQKAPVFVHVHGGGWDHGTRFKSWGPMSPWIAAGFSAVDVEYRLTGAATAPAAVQDERCALAWVVKNADKYNFDANKVVLFGESAGGHLSMMSAFLPVGNDLDLPQCKVQPKVVAVLDFFGPYSVNPEDRGAFASGATTKWIGADAKPSVKAMEVAMSPITYVRPGLPPVFIVHGDKDPTVPYVGSQLLQIALTKAGVKNYLDTVPDGLHGIWPKEENTRVHLDSLRFLKTVGVIQ